MRHKGYFGILCIVSKGFVLYLLYIPWVYHILFRCDVKPFDILFSLYWCFQFLNGNFILQKILQLIINLYLSKASMHVVLCYVVLHIFVEFIQIGFYSIYIWISSISIYNFHLNEENYYKIQPYINGELKYEWSLYLTIYIHLSSNHSVTLI